MRLRPWVHVRGGYDNTLYLTRIFLMPYTRWGQLLVHIFWRPDADQDPHDHPFDFWTCPIWAPHGCWINRAFRRGYNESVLNKYGFMCQNFVKAYRWTFKPAAHTHRVSVMNHFPVITIVWRKPRTRLWGFWVLNPGLYLSAEAQSLTPKRGNRFFVPWRTYIGKDKSHYV